MKICMTRLCALLCLLLCLSMLPGMACAQVEPEREGSLTLSLTEADKGLAGVEFSVYRVASVNEGAQFDLLDGLDAGSLDVNRLENAEDWPRWRMRWPDRLPRPMERL